METYAQTLPEVKAMNGNAAAQLRVDIEFLKRVLGCFFFFFFLCHRTSQRRPLFHASSKYKTTGSSEKARRAISFLRKIQSQEAQSGGIRLILAQSLGFSHTTAAAKQQREAMVTSALERTRLLALPLTG